MACVLLVDDEPDFVSSVADLLRLHGHKVRTADTLNNARRVIDSEALDAVLLDLMLPDGNGLELLDEIAKGRRRHVKRVILITGHPGVKTQINHLSGPGVSYLTKPIDSRELMTLLRAFESEHEETTGQETARLRFGLLVGESSQMQEVYREIERIAPTDSPVLICGETGTGKELVAEALHHQSGRSGSFVPVNCGSLSRELAGSELFGHEKGSFTGATRKHTGFFEQAHTGTLFLDELTEMPMELQPHFLRVLETRFVLPIGGEKPLSVDARVVAATNRTEPAELVDGTLRKDLYYRLSVFPIKLPPLRARPEDVPALAEHFLAELCQQYGPRKRLSESALQRLQAYDWPGNVRELRHVIHRAYILSESNACELDLPERFESPFGAEQTSGGLKVGRSIRDMERELILQTLAHFDGDKRAAAEVLGVSLNTLYNRLNQYEREKRS